MKKTVAVLILGLFCAAAFASDLAAVHQKAGVRLKAEPTEQQCLSCHGSYESLGEKTAALSPNPHRSHMGRVQCNACHAWKGRSRLMCQDCHNFPELEAALRRGR